MEPSAPPPPATMDLELGAQQPVPSSSPEPTTSFLQKHKKWLIIVGAGAGVFVGLMCKATSASSDTLMLVGYLGELYINALMLMVVPYICCSMVVSQRPDTSGMDSSGMGTVALKGYACTTCLAVCEALIFTNIFAPGVSGVEPNPDTLVPQEVQPHWFTMQDARGRTFLVADPNATGVQLDVMAGHPMEAGYELPSGMPSALESILSIGNQILPRNVIKTFYSSNLLGLIVFGLLLGQAIAKQPGCEPVFDMTATVADALMSVVLQVVEFTPIGIGSLIAKGLGAPNSQPLSPYLLFIICALSAQLCHACLLGLVLKVFTHTDPKLYLRNIQPAMLMAIATDSSAATLPVTMACGETNRLHKRTIDLVFPLGATVNMDGSTIYYVQAVIFMSAISGWTMSFAAQLQCGIVGALICCGAAPIPGGFIVFIWMIIDLCGVPERVDMDELQSSLAVLLAINWFMDRCRTTVNIVGDSVVAAVVEAQIYGPRAFEASKPKLDALGGAVQLESEGSLERGLSASSIGEALDRDSGGFSGGYGVGTDSPRLV